MSEKPPPNTSEADKRVELTRLWMKSLPTVELFIRGLVWDRHAQEDVLQATAEQVSRSFDDYDRERPFQAWVLGVARHRVLAYFRDQQRDRLRFSEDTVDKIAASAERVSPEMQDRLDALQFCMSKLRAKHQKLLRLRYLEELKPRQLAEQIGGSPNAVSAMIRRVRMAIAECIEKHLETRVGR
jgi:RNA polymerase sigma-70 factor (ECF subfamily)